MGYDIYVMDDSEDFTYAETGCTFNYNEQYTKITGKTLFELLDGKKLKDTIDVLNELVSKLGIAKYADDMWEPTPGNAGYAANSFLTLAKKYPNAKWKLYR